MATMMSNKENVMTANRVVEEMKESEDVKNIQGDPEYLGKLVKISLDQYDSAKKALADSKTFGPRLVPVVDWTEGQTKAVLKRVPIQDVVNGIDRRTDQVVNYSSKKIDAVRQTPKNSLAYVHGKLQSLRVDVPADEPQEDPGLKNILVTAKSAAAENLNVLLDSSQGFLQQYLPLTPEELHEDGKRSEIKTAAKRGFKISKQTASKVIERALTRVGEIKRRTSETIHVDLIKYSQFLDAKVKAPIAKRLAFVDEKLGVSEKATAVNAKYVAPVRERVSKRVEAGRTWVSEVYKERVTKSIDAFNQELALQKEIAKSKSGDEDLTISAGLSAVFAAASTRLSSEYKSRVSPTINRIFGTREPYEEVYEDEDSEETDDPTN